MVALRGAVRQAHMAVADQRLDARAAHIGQGIAQEPVEPLAGLGLVHLGKQAFGFGLEGAGINHCRSRHFRSLS